MNSRPSNPAVVYSRLPLAAPATTSGDESKSEWLGWGVGSVYAAFMLMSGGFIGYRATLKENPVKSNSTSLSVKPHPFLKAPPTMKVLPASTVASIAVNALGIATVYCFAGFSFSIAGIALACGVRSPNDVSVKLEALKDWGPVSSMMMTGLKTKLSRTRKRLLKSAGIGESEAQKEAERELQETAHLSAENQLARLLAKHAEKAPPVSSKIQTEMPIKK